MISRLLLGCGESGDGKNLSPQYCSKLLFALSGFVRNNVTIQAAADEQGMFDWLLDVGVKHSNTNVAKKALGILDIILIQNPALRFLDGLAARQEVLTSTLLLGVKGGQSGDADLAEKALG